MDYCIKTNKDALYIGAGYEKCCAYKADYPAFEFWNGRIWSNNIKTYKYLCDRDSSLNKLSELQECKKEDDKKFFSDSSSWGHYGNAEMKKKFPNGKSRVVDDIHRILNQLSQTYCRLRPSEIHGIGVFAVRDIPEGTNLFPECTSPAYYKIDLSHLNKLNKNVIKMMEDFFVFEKDYFFCPEKS